MRNNSVRANNFVILIFVILSLAVVIGIIFFPAKNNYYLLAISLLGGFYSLYTGIRKISQTHQQVHWYTQPSILIGIAFLVGLLWNLLRSGILPIFPNSIFIENVLVILGLVLFLVAGYLFFRGILRKTDE